MIAEPFQHRDESYLTLDSWNKKDNRLKVGFTTKNGGESTGDFCSLNLGLHVHDHHQAVINNRNRLAEKLNAPLEAWVFAEQTHSNNIQKVTKQHSGRGTLKYSDGMVNCDAFYTNQTGIMLSLCFADCVPIYFFHPEKQLVGLAHAGWKGTVQNIAGEMINCWSVDEEIPRNEILVAIGPSIGFCCYTVDERVISAIDSEVLEVYSKPYETLTTGKYKLDLKKLNKNLLLHAGIKEENILVSKQCTSCEAELYFSHRRDNGKTGRMLSFIGINEEA
ncbi:YfiH family protein [Metabacillus crassostreae]|nr:peptidoglycan editing factor PgeF [Metabacillus crassostreae]MBM7603412.1 YfiH family protein [Metabacillus crassostreae]